MKMRIAIMALGLIAAAPAYAEVVRDTGGVTAPNKSGITTGSNRGIIMNNDGRGITTGSSAVTGNVRTGVQGIRGTNSDVIRANPSVSLDGVNGTNAVNTTFGGVSGTAR